jgi:hypothetical protein
MDLEHLELVGSVTNWQHHHSPGDPTSKGVVMSIAPDADNRTLSPPSVQNDEPALTDELGRSQYVRALAEVVLNAETPLVIAIYGGWGTGKTSLMRQLQRRLVDDTGRQSEGTIGVGSVWFDPWMHESDENPALGLLHQIAADLKQTDNAMVRKDLLGVGRAMVSEVQIPVVGLRVGKMIDALADTEFRRRSEQAQLRNRFQSVLNAARRQSGRIVIFIDDLDRCDPRTALRLLTALRLFMDFDGCVFILAIDRTHLEAAIAAETEGMGVRREAFLDKIVQLPFTIPAVHPVAMAIYVATRLPGHLTECHAFLVAAGVDHPRLVKRLINVLGLCDSLVDRSLFSQEYDPRILAFIVLIQDQAPALYEVLRSDPTAIHDLKPASDLAHDASGTTISTEPSALWLKHVAPSPQLARSLLEVPIAPELDLAPYLMLAATAASGVGDWPPLARGPSLFSLLVPDEQARAALSFSLGHTGIFRELKPKVAQRLVIAELVNNQLRRALELPLADFLIQAWSTHASVRAALTDSLSSPTDVVSVSLGRQSQSTTMRIPVDSISNIPHRLPDLELSIQMEMFEGTELRIGAGRVLAGSGVADLQMTLSYDGLELQRLSKQMRLDAILGYSEV